MSEYSNLVSFLRKGKAALTITNSCKFHLVIGNESADLDSVASAIVYAFFLSESIKDEHVFLPIISIHSDDLVLRTEVIALLNRCGISQKDMVHLNEIDFSLLDVSNVTLVDHNNSSSSLKEVASFVSNIIDHHEDTCDFDVEKKIKTVGSCATLITEEIYYSDFRTFLSIPMVADFLMSAILIDTYNLDLHSGRTTELDIFMGEILSGFSKEDTDALFNYLQKAKTDISSMASFDILRKDYKPLATPVIKMGISSVTLPSSGLISRNNFLQAAEDFLSSRKLTVILVMFLSFKDNSPLPCREIAVFAKEGAFLERVCSYLMASNELGLQERTNEIHDALRNFLRLFDQEPKLSRKFVLPLLEKITIAA